MAEQSAGLPPHLAVMPTWRRNSVAATKYAAQNVCRQGGNRRKAGRAAHSGRFSGSGSAARVVGGVFSANNLAAKNMRPSWAAEKTVNGPKAINTAANNSGNRYSDWSVCIADSLTYG